MARQPNKDTKPQCLDLAALFSGKEREVSFQRTFPLSYTFEDVRCTGELSVRGKLTDYSGTLQFCAAFSFPYTAACARCLASVERTLDFVVDEQVTERRSENPSDADEGITACGEVIDLAKIAVRGVTEQLPLRHLCREDCKGLCPVCGADLNTGDCACDRKNPDPRLIGLSDFFNE